MPSLIISFIIEVEKMISGVLESLAESKGGELRKMAEDCRRDAEQLEKVFKETVVELSLEPIEGFDVASLKNEIVNLLASAEKIPGLLEVISRLEKIYTSFAKSIASVSPETSMHLKKMLRKKEKQKIYLSSLK